jgi:hypothetical protein
VDAVQGVCKMNYDSYVITAILFFDFVGATASVGCAWFAWLTFSDRRRARIKRAVTRVLKAAVGAN